MPQPALYIALFPELLWYQGEFKTEHAVLASDQGIIEVGPSSRIESTLSRWESEERYFSRRRLPGRALLPGFVNTHSHAFQRAIRGRTEYPGDPSDRDDDFWSWRGLMYQAATRLNPEDVESVAQAVFVEMVKAGITRVGEFHYLHHQQDGTPFDDPDELARRVLSGARSAGLKVTLLRSFYERAGVGSPEPQGAQKIFCDPNRTFYLECLDRLRKEGIDVGVTAHSVRAVTRESLCALAEYAERHSLPFHIHVSEQQEEIRQCLEEYQLRPVELLQEVGLLKSHTSLVHAIHLTEKEVEMVGAGGCTIASCPTTERNLGDGVVPAPALLKAGARFTFGTDSQCQIWLPEDARQLEYHLRLLEEKRSLLFSQDSQAGPALLDMLTVNGARSLGGEREGRIEVEGASHFVAIDLTHLSLAGADRASLPLDLIFSANPAVVTDVWVDGAEIVSDGRHRAERQAVDNLQRVMRKLRDL